MKKITLLCFLMSISLGFSQMWTTGTVTLDTDFTVQFDVTPTTVTMTMIGPSSRWLGVGPGIAQGNSMGNSGDDAIVFTSAGLQDRNMPAGNGQPNLDASQDWTLVTDNVVGSTRTVVATRARVTGDPNDFAFPTTPGTLPILWAKGGSTSFGYHSGGRGGALANLTLSVDQFETQAPSFTMAPNPGVNTLNITMTNPLVDKSTVSVYDVLGKLILNGSLSNEETSFNISDWNRGVYLVRIANANGVETKRFIKQ